MKFVIKIYLIFVILFINLNIVYCSENELESQESSFIEILYIKREENNIIDYSLRENGKPVLSFGIEAFAVDGEERIYLSNYAAGKILVFHKNELVKEINISGFLQPRDIEICEGSLYIFEDLGKITAMSLGDLEKINEISVPSKINDETNQNIIEIGIPVSFINDFLNGQISVYYNNAFIYFPVYDTKGKLPLDEYKLPILDGQVYKRLISIDKNRNIYILGTQVDNNGDKIDIKEIVYKYNYSGELLGIFETINDKNYITPYKYISVNELGNIYQLMVLRDCVKVVKLKFTDKNNLDIGAEEYFEVDSNLTDILIPVVDKSYTKRLKFYNKAVELINLKWTFIPGENNNKLNDILAPFYLKNISEEVELMGIPYCWGGYDSLNTKSTNQKWDNFTDAINMGAIPGNIGVTLNYIPGTTGLDCSGFVSVVLGLESREPSWNFLHSDQFVEKIGYHELIFMDLLVKNGHMLFYFDRNDYGITSIETNTLGSEWKVKFFTWSWRALRDMDYRARRYKGMDE